MSLRVWLPLTKDLRQQGLSNVTVTNNGATYSATSGKLGGCYSFGTGASALSLPASTFTSLTGDFSITCWVKIISWNTSYATVWAATSTSASYANIIAGMFRNSTSSKILFCIGNNSSSTQTSCMTTNDVSLNVWNHFVCTYTAGKILLYQNGELVSSYNTSIIPAFSTTQYVNIGKMRENTYQSNCSVNDFRIYDHCLSPMEVKELAKGLVLHYPLNRQGWGQENLDNFSSVVSNWTMDGLTGSNYTDSVYGNVIKLVTSATNKRMYHSVVSTLWQNGQVYTVSFLAKADTNGRTCDMSRSVADFSPTFTLTTQWKRYSGKITSTATPGGGTLSFRINQSGATIYITQIKLEKGEIATPYCPSSSETLYTTLGLNGTTEYDCSGYCNNGTRTGTFTWTSDTPKYNVSTKFNGAEVIVVPFTCGSISEAVTVACWGYESNWNVSTAERLLGAATNSSGWCIGDYGSENTLFAFYANGGYNAATGFKQLSTGWHHFVITFDGLNLIYYVDGQQFSKKTFSTKQVATGNYNINIGRHYGGGYNFKGNMSDIRIYATALSADDVKSLYQNSAYIDSSGNVYGAVHSEV